MAIDRGITLTATTTPGSIQLTSADGPGRVELRLPFDGDPASVDPQWGSFIAGMAKELGATTGLRGHLVSDIPAGAGLSSSAALECLIGRALGFDGTPLELAQTARRAEHSATGVPTGIMDQLCIAAATAGHATLIDCHDLTVEQVPVPDDIDIVVRFIAHRTLLGSAYAERVAECARAEAEIGPLRTATLEQVATIGDDTVEPPSTPRRERERTGPTVRRRTAASRLHRARPFDDRRTRQPPRRLRHVHTADGHGRRRAQRDARRVRRPHDRWRLRRLPGCDLRTGAIRDGWVVRASAGARVLPPAG